MSSRWENLVQCYELFGGIALKNHAIFYVKISELLHFIQSCIGDTKSLATANMLKVKDNKTELMNVT